MKYNPHHISILILDDDISITKGLQHFLSEMLHYHVASFTLPGEALKALKKSSPDILICDLHLPEMDGITFIKMLKDMPGKQPEIIIITGHGEKENAIECLRLGAIDFLEKPFSLETLKLSIGRVIQFIHSKKIIPAAADRISVSGRQTDLLPIEMIGNSKAMEHIRGLIGKIASTNDTSVLITGETGTGKEVIARQIHFLSSRKTRSFYAKNCATVPESLFESEFFGHVRGSFTNAVSDHKGWFEVANESTLFLDEISTLPLAMQPKLLRVLEEKNLNRMGSSTNIPLNIRIIAASNTNLQELCAEHKFRLDLFYRLNIFSIHVPPLRDRKEDIAGLFDYFVAQAAVRHQKEPVVFPKEMYDMLQVYPFPGNVRELKNIAERLIILCDESQNPAEILSSIISPNNNPLQETTATGKSITQQEIELIIAALKKSDNVVARAARILQITEQSLLRRIKKHRITLPV